MYYFKRSERLNSEHQTRNNVAVECVLWHAVFVILPLLMCGCGQNHIRKSSQIGVSQSANISKEELRELLNNFEDFASAAVAQATSQLDELQPEFKIRKMSLIHRTRYKQALNTMLNRDDPIEAFIETWALSVRTTNYFKDGEGSEVFGEHQHIAVTNSEKLQTEIERIGKIFLKNNTYIETQDKINKFARTNPITGNYSNTILFVTEVKPSEQRLFEEVINLPLAPFKAMTGVDRTASAIYGLRDSTDHITDVVEELPESARWQLLLLLMEMEETKVVKTFLESMSEFSNSSVRFADTAEKLPKQLRQELSVLIQEIDNKQANLQTTIEKTEKASIAIEKTLGQADKVAASFKTTAESVNEAAAAWEKAAIATDSVLAEFKQLRTPRKDATKITPFKISDYRDTAESVGKTVNEMKDLTAEIRTLIESEQLSKYSSMPLTITNLMVWRLSQLIFLIFILALVYRIINVRYLKSSK
ncbi:MAG: hypothetical protein GQ571_08405 [Desulfobacterales bacterium]|nr:hypothetical protein [Desulfobacterales bacterium]